MLVEKSRLFGTCDISTGIQYQENVAEFISKQIGDILNKVNDLKYLILSMDPDTEEY